MSNTEDLKDSAVSDPEQIDNLKEEEKEKLAAAEQAYAGRTGTSGDEVGVEHNEIEEAGRGRIPWVPGLILIGLGLIFLLNNITGFSINNWWALFILIPAIGSFSKAADIIRSEGGLTSQAWGALAGGIILTLVASAFLFNLDWGKIWPVFLIIGGLGMLIGAFRSS